MCVMLLPMETCSCAVKVEVYSERLVNKQHPEEQSRQVGVKYMERFKARLGYKTSQALHIS